MGLYEDQPWLLIPVVLVIVVVYDVAKWFVLGSLRRRREEREGGSTAGR